MPKLCHEIEKALSVSNKELGCFMTTEEFVDWVDTDVEVVLSSDDDEQDVAIEFLDSSGIVSSTIAPF